MLQWYLPFSSLKYNCMQSSSSSCSLFINILSRITFIMNIGKQAIIVDAHKIIDVNEKLHD